jgi:nucleoside 2-deoxyribosyltransferase
VLASALVRLEGRTKAEVSRDYGVSPRWVYELCRRFDAEGEAGLEPRFRDQAAAAGMEVYLAEHDVQPGESLAEKVRKAIRRSDAVVVLLTKSGAASAYVHQEVGVAIEAGKPVIPIVETGVSVNSCKGRKLRFAFQLADP